MNLPYSVSCYINISLIRSTALDCLTAFKLLNEEETLINNKSFCLKQIDHNVPTQVHDTYQILKH